MPERRRQVNLRLGEETFARVEELRGDTSRQRWLERAVRMRIKLEDRARHGPFTTERTMAELRRAEARKDRAR